MEEVYKFLKDEMPKHTTIIVGVSAGPDSMALLHLLLTLRKEKDIEIICAHINHNVRLESKNEAKMVKKYCKDNNLVFETMTIKEYHNNNFESEAREKRYAFFEEMIKKYKAKYLLTAHHGDDLIETILMRVVRGSTFKGYAGFEKNIDKGTYRILRPFISITKEDILDYIQKHSIEYAVDKSNTSDEYTRNRYRKKILPFLKEEDNKVHEKFLKFSHTIIEYNKYIDKQMMKVIDEVYQNNIINIEQFKKIDITIQDKIINYVMEKLYQDDMILISDVHKQNIMNLIYSKKPNIYIYLPNDIKAIKAYKLLSFEKGENKGEPYKIEFESYVSLPNGKSLEKIEDNEEKSNFICRLNSKELSMPLYVRNKKNGDVMEVKGLSGRKKIKDIFINEKISTKDRKNWPLLVDNNDNILWVPGLKKSKYDKSKKESYNIIIWYY